MRHHSAVLIVLIEISCLKPIALKGRKVKVALQTEAIIRAAMVGMASVVKPIQRFLMAQDQMRLP